LFRSSGLVLWIKSDPRNQQSPSAPCLISPGFIESLYMTGVESYGTISCGLFHSTIGISIAYSGGWVGSLYSEVSLAGNSESPNNASLSAQIYLIF
jgi:hypothetical protein